MYRAVEEFLANAPGAVIAIGIIVLIIYVIREYRKIRQEINDSVKQTVNAKLGEIMSDIQSEISRLDIISSQQESKIDKVNSMFEQFTNEVKQKSTDIEGIYNEAHEKLGALKESIPSVHEYSARDLIGLAQSRDTTVAQAELCSRILSHEDATAKDLESAGDMMRKSGRYSLAMQLYSSAHQNDPELKSAHVELLCLKAELQYRERNEAINTAQERVLSSPDRQGFGRVANALINLGRYEDLLDYSNRFLATIQSRSSKLKAIGLRNVAVAQNELGQIEECLETYKEAFAIAPEDENIMTPYLGILEEQNEHQKYLEICRQLIKTNPADVRYYRFYIKGLLELGEFSNALQWIDIAKKLSLTEMDKATLQRYEQQARAANDALEPTP